jgi:hypothetical protein
MATNLIIDVSVVIAAVSPSEPGHVQALEFLQRAHGRTRSMSPAIFVRTLRHPDASLLRK